MNGDRRAATSRSVVAIIAVIVLVVAVLSALYLQGFVSPPKKITIVKVMVTDNGYLPRNTTVVVGVNSTVLWVWGSGQDVHSVTEGNPLSPAATPLFNSGILGPGANFTYTFNSAGVYEYYDSHVLSFFGFVIVKS